MMDPPEKRYTYEGKGKRDVEVTFSREIENASGLCVFGIDFGMPQNTAVRFIAAATGWDFDKEDVFQTGKRIFTMRYAFNLREGQKVAENVLPNRCIGDPPLTEGPLEGVTIDHNNLADQFIEGVDWDKETMLPTRESLETLGGMEDVIRDLYG